MQREIGKLDGQLKSAQIDNDFLRDENTQIRGDIGSLSDELAATRKSLVTAREDAQAQRAQSEQTLAQLQTALDRIQVQACPPLLVMAGVLHPDGIVSCEIGKIHPTNKEYFHEIAPT